MEEPNQINWHTEEFGGVVETDFTCHFKCVLDSADADLKITAVYNSDLYYPAVKLRLTTDGISAYLIDREGTQVNAYIEEGDWELVPDTGFVVGDEYHVAVIGNGRDILLFIEGHLVKTWTAAIDYLMSESIGVDPADYNNRVGFKLGNGTAHIDAFELTREVKWTEDFTVPTEPPAPGVITRHYLAWSNDEDGQGEPVAITEDTTVTLTDGGGNSIRATVDFSEMPEVDNDEDVTVIHIDAIPRRNQIVAFAELTDQYRTAEYRSKRYEFPYTSFSVIKVQASAYPIDIDIIYPNINKTTTVTVTSNKPHRFRGQLVDALEVGFVTDAIVTDIFIASALEELPK